MMRAISELPLQLSLLLHHTKLTILTLLLLILTSGGARVVAFGTPGAAAVVASKVRRSERIRAAAEQCSAVQYSVFSIVQHKQYSYNHVHIKYTPN